MSVWSATRVPWLPSPVVTGPGWLYWLSGSPLVSPSWTSMLKSLSVAAPTVKIEQQQVQNKCYLGAPRCTALAPKVSHKMATFDSMEVSLCYVLAKNPWINFILSVYIQKWICKYCLRQHSISIVVEILWFNKAFFNFINIEYSPFTILCVLWYHKFVQFMHPHCAIIFKIVFKLNTNTLSVWWGYINYGYSPFCWKLMAEKSHGKVW